MRILLVAVLHYTLPQFDWVVRVAPNYDLVAVAGDSLDISSAVPLGRAALATQLASDAACRPSRWIWVHHWPPLGSPNCWTGRRDYGDADVGGWIAQYQPDMVLTGHVHEPPFKPSGHWADRIGATWVFNAGRQIGPVPCHIVIDLDAGSAMWRSMMGDEGLKLADPQAPPRGVF